jgi:hypothetical protein
MAQAPARSAAPGEVGTKSLKPKVVKVFWNGGSPYADPIEERVEKGQRIEWKLGDKASDFEIDFIDWPLKGPKKQLKADDPGEDAEVLGTHCYSCTVFGPKEKGEITQRAGMAPRIVIIDPGGDGSEEEKKLLAKLDRIIGELQDLRVSLAGIPTKAVETPNRTSRIKPESKARRGKSSL